MKKKLLILFLSCFLLIIFSMTAFAFSTGDVDNSGAVTVSDARQVLRYVASLEHFSRGQETVADADDDGAVTAGDARMILRVSAKLDVFPEPAPGSILYDAKDYGVSGDGQSDEGQLIQKVLDISHENGGGTIYFPEGTYCISKTVFFYSNQTLLFEDGAVLRRVRSEDAYTCGVFLCNWFEESDTTAGTIACENVVIDGATFDMDSSITVDVAPVNTCHAGNVVIRNCHFLNNYNAHCIEINSSEDVTIDHCTFSEYVGAAKNYRYNEMIQIDKSVNRALGSRFDELGKEYSRIVGYEKTTKISADPEAVDCLPCRNVTISNCVFTTNANCTAIGNHHESGYTTENEQIYIFGNVFQGGTGSRGYISFDAHTRNVDIYDNQFLDGECGVSAQMDEANISVHDNTFKNCKTIATPNVTVSRNSVSDPDDVS